MRIGEACALKWEDIDFNGKMLHVTKTVQRIATFGTESKSAVKITTPKSESSVRDIPLPDFLIDMLRKYRGKDTDYILSGTEKVVEPRCFSYRYKALLKKANVPSRKYHSLRHTFAVNALHQDFDIKTLSELLGHSNANITMSVYLHSSMDRKSACMDRLQALV
jgi:integrase